ncbi:class I SAM-dependent methyltransferase [Mycobacterium sp.]|uniref:class I SAM-dependent methyltransferase n=1 Tax=Mycobacterium sp. TaxID=1785 RepID=UPI002C0E4BAD|nr:class I SAM-dependent methyltransferase [Mycobacterium sp.]HTQ21125.1 class I SAM-dependent methyltransferase [Mycobacterium sp.]
MDDALSFRSTFDEEAELYNTARPGYPEELFEALIVAADLAHDAKLLEIGPGTGQATKPLAQRGFEITAVELGASLADVARRELGGFPGVKVITGAFEDVALASNAYDLVYAATAFHWIKPDVKFKKPYALLKPGGHIAVIRGEDISDENGDDFFMASQPIYDKYTSNDGISDYRLPCLGDLQPAEIDDKLFEQIYFDAFPKLYYFTAQQYTDLLGTYSGRLAMRSDKRRVFLQEIAALINNEFDGGIHRRFANTLSIAKRK